MRNDIIGVEDFHGAAFYHELIDKDLTYQFIDAIEENFDVPALIDDSKMQNGLAEVKKIAEDFKITDINLIKPSIGEATRVLLRRLPEKILVKSLHDENLEHLYQLAAEKCVPIEIYPLKNYKACGLIKNLADN